MFLLGWDLGAWFVLPSGTLQAYQCERFPPKKTFRDFGEGLAIMAV